MSEDLTRKEQYNQTKEDSIEAVREIYEMLLKGYTQAEISPIINHKYSCDRRTTRDWIKRVLRRIGDAQKANQKQYGLNVGLAIERLLRVYDVALENGKEEVALKALNQAMQLQGVIETKLPSPPVTKEPKKKEKEEPDVDFSELSDEELKNMVGE